MLTFGAYDLVNDFIRIVFERCKNRRPVQKNMSDFS